MPCTGPYALPWEFASFWCTSALLTGVDTTVGLVGQANLTDTQDNFMTFGIKANTGMILENLTKNTAGYITAVTVDTLTATGVLWDSADQFRVTTLTNEERSTIGHFLTVAASDIHAAMAASGMCSCTLASWATEYLKKLNIIDAAIYYTCPCAKPTFTDALRKMYLDWVVVQLDNIRMGKIELCEGETGSEFPAVDWADQGVSEFSQAQIIINDVNRTP